MSTDLAAVVREVVESSDETDPAALAKLVSEKIADEDTRAALDQALPVLVKREFRRYAEPWTVHAGGQPAEEEQPRGGRPSPRVQRIRERWLSDRIAGLDGYKRLGDCTIDDLEHAAAEREAHANATLARAGQLRALAALLAEHQVATVRDLPGDALARARDAA